MSSAYQDRPINPLLRGLLGNDNCNGFFDMNSANPSPADQMDGVGCETCKHCGHMWHGDDPRCPDCGRMVVEYCITFEDQKACPWGGPLREGEEAEIHGYGDCARWIWISSNYNAAMGDIDSREHQTSDQDAAALDRLLGWLVRTGRK